MSSKVITLQNGVPKQTSDDHYSKNEVDALLYDLNSRLSYLESIKLSIERFVMSDQDLEFPIISLQGQPIVNDRYSVSVTVGRLEAEINEDFELIEDTGFFKIVWKGDFASNGIEAIESGDIVVVKYYYEG